MNNILLIFFLTSLQLLQSSVARAETVVGGIRFADKAFADVVVESNGDFFFFGGATDLDTAYLGSNIDSSAASGTPGAYLVLGFRDNAVVNGPGNDIAVFEHNRNEPLRAALSPDEIATNFVEFETAPLDGVFNDPERFPVNFGLFDLSDLGVPDNEAIFDITLFSICPEGPSVCEAGDQVVPAFAAVAAVPLPPAFFLLGSAVLVAVARRRRA